MVSKINPPLLTMTRSEKKIYYKFFKPYGVLSQFTDEDGNPGLKHFINVPADVYPVGRLDKDSEGLLILTNDNRLKTRLLAPSSDQWRTYLVQVEGAITNEAISRLCNPMKLNIKGKGYQTLSAKAERIASPGLPTREPPVRFRKHIPTSWIRIHLREGKNRQVRKMTAQVGFPTLRLVRIAHGDVELGNLSPGKYSELSDKEVESFVKINE